MKTQLYLISISLLLTCANLSADTHYVSQGNPNAATPYATWSTAATNIQDAVNAAEAGDTVMVTNGTYYGGIIVPKPLTLLCVNGPLYTTIYGGRGSCISLTDGATLSGFTLTGGNNWNNNGSGGGVNCTSTNAFITNCIIKDNFAFVGGGVYGGTLYNCLIIGNSAQGCGGVNNSVLYNCVVAGNSAPVCGGVAQCRLKNCIVYFNWSIVGGTNYMSSSTGDMSHCCTTPLPPSEWGIGNIDFDPLFVDFSNGNLRLQSNSPCINAGLNAFVASFTDLDGNPRVVSGTVDVGPYEFQGSGSAISYAWLQQYGLPTDGSADSLDLDGTGMNNWQKWIAGLNPTNPASVLMMNTPTFGALGLTITWQSVDSRTYYLQRTTNLAAQSPFLTIQSNIVGQLGTTTYLDITATNGNHYYYRVGVQ